MKFGRITDVFGPAWVLGAMTAVGSTAALAQVQMTDVSIAAGLGAEAYLSQTDHSLGVNWLDYDNDGWPDLFLVSGSPGGDPPRLPHLFHNNHDGTFKNVDELLPDFSGNETSGSVYADYDRDGDLDLYVYTDNNVWDPSPKNNPQDGPANFLLQNRWIENGGGVVPGQPLFVDVAVQAGVDDLADPPFGPLPGHRTKTAAWLDFDRDGCIDLYAGHWVMNATLALANRDRFYRNRCDGTFEDSTAASGVNPDLDPETYRAALASIAAHLDGDLWPDLYVVNAGGGGLPQPHINDLIYFNNAGGTFTEVADTGAFAGIGNDSQAGMGIDVADIDLDGDWDVYISDLRSTAEDDEPRGNVLYLGNGDGTFQDNTAPDAGLQGHNSWGVNFFDVDSDGDEDLYVSTMNGATGDFAELLYLNNGDGTFTNVGVDIGMTTGNSRGSAVADYDRDGDLDLAVVNQGGPLQLYRNDTPGAGNWFEVKLEGSDSNRDAIGAVVELTAGDLSLMRQVKGGSSAHSQDSLVVHFGLGAAAHVELLRVLWPSGRIDELRDLSVNQRLRFGEGQIFADGFESGGLTAWSAAVP